MIILRDKNFGALEMAYKSMPKRTVSREFFFKRGLDSLVPNSYRNTISAPEFTGRVIGRGRRGKDVVAKEHAAMKGINKSINSKVPGKSGYNKRVIKRSLGNKESSRDIEEFN